jgi:hypothetical protein
MLTMACNCVKDEYLQAMNQSETTEAFLPFIWLDAKRRSWFQENSSGRGQGKTVDHTIHWIHDVLTAV